MKARKPFNIVYCLRLVGFAALAAVILIYLALPVGFGLYAVVPGRAAVGSLPGGFQNVSLKTSDGVQLQAWYRPPTNGAAVIILHGAGSSRESLRPYAEMLARHGYGALAVDLRGHGESQGKTNRLGWQSAPDVAAAAEFLQKQNEVHSIGGLGFSMGGEVILGAVSLVPAIRAVAADGASRRSTEELLALESERPLVRNFTARLMYASAGIFSGDPPPPPLLDSMLASGSARFYFIAGGNNGLEVDFNRLFADKLGSRAVLWVAPGAGHLGAYGLHPAEYEKRLIDFFDSELLNVEN